MRSGLAPKGGAGMFFVLGEMNRAVIDFVGMLTSFQLFKTENDGNSRIDGQREDGSAES